MVLRDLHVVQFESEDPASAHLKRSKLEWAHTQVVVQMCLTIAEDLKSCLEADQSDCSMTPAKGTKQSSKRPKIDPERYGCHVQ
jgi:hypothetical protein